DWEPYSGTQHYKYCDTCSYQIIEDHVDEDADAICDKCEDEIHICIDEDGDHYCDECQEFIEGLCTDENGDHTCDGENCGEKMEWLCADENGDHTCDNEKCQRHMKELCSSEDETVYCDICDRNFCPHEYLISYKSLGDGTHSGICDYCGEGVTEDCYVWEYVYDEEKHYERCVCEYVLDEAEHTFEEGYIYKTSVAGHWLGCDDCAFEKCEEHKFSEGECICGTEENEVHDIYVGGKALENGEYIDNEGNITTQKPAGGYAYYKDGVLELNKYKFIGKGVLSLRESDLLQEQYAAVFATKDLTIKLVGENTIAETSTDEMEGIYGNSIFVIGDLTFEGEGRLNVPEGDDGIEVQDGTVTIKEGHVEIGTVDPVMDDGLDIENGNLIIDGGYLNVHSKDHGADIEGDFNMKKGTALITAGDDRLNVMRDIKVSGGQMRVDAEDYGFDSEEGSIFVSGGEIYMTTNDEDGFDSGKKIEISGGNIFINATGDCLEAPTITITGGSLELTAGILAIDSGETIIDEMMEVFDSEDEFIENPDFTELDYAKIIKTETEHDWGEWEVVIAPDYLNEGLKKRVCKLNGRHFEEEIIPKLTVKTEETEKIEGPDNTKEYRVAYQEDVIIVPDNLNITIQDIKNDLLDAVKNGSLRGNVKVVFGEATIGYFNDNNEFIPIESDEFFKDGKTLDIVLTYPEGSDSNDIFEIYHFRDDGKVENCKIKSRTEKGLMITVDHLSPFAIAYESVNNTPIKPSKPGKPYAEDKITIVIPKEETEESNPNTGAPIIDITGAGIVVLAAAAIIFEKKNK
ncbi:MAG: carbohydrate-binding domain-containing protein, partial [Oscillospiraceae bacterium]|nr:carbohydrate-binding domain-containing protein [Oscillospiraceae bacterium]